MNEKLNYFTAIRFLSKYILKYKKNFILFYISWLLGSASRIYIPIMFAVMIDEIVYYKNINIFFNISLVFAVMLIFSCILYYFSETQHCYLTIMYAFDIKKDLFETLQTADAQFMSDSNSGDIINTIQSYADECIHFVIQNIIHMFNNSFLLILYIIYVFLLGWQIGLLMMVIVPLSTFVSIKFGKRIKQYSDQQRKNFGEYSGWLYEILSGLRDIRMLGAEHTVNKAFIKHQRKLTNNNNKNGLLALTAQNILTLVNLLVQLSIFGVAAYMAYWDNITIGVLTLILAYFAGMTQNVGFLSGIYLVAQNRISYIQRIYDFVNAPTEKDWTGKNELSVTNGYIRFFNIDFAYGKRENVINGFSIDIKGGEKLAFVGKSGSGKTTLAHMLIGFYRPQNGYIEIDGQRLDACSLVSIRNNIGFIQQDTLIFDGSIRENIILGKRNASDTEIFSACESAGIIDYIQALPDGINTVVGKNGIGLSGGQKQRLAIARIYLKNPKVIIFDEATSSLDSETEEQIHEAWSKVLIGRTAIIIAHRQSSVMHCDKAAIIENGRLVEIGSPIEMIKNSDIFKTIFAVKNNKEVNVYD